jgi:hypothetical protein
MKYLNPITDFILTALLYPTGLIPLALSVCSNRNVRASWIYIEFSTTAFSKEVEPLLVILIFLDSGDCQSSS